MWNDFPNDTLYRLRQFLLRICQAAHTNINNDFILNQEKYMCILTSWVISKNCVIPMYFNKNSPIGTDSYS